MKNKNLFPIILLVVIIVIAIVAVFTTNIEKTSENKTELQEYTPEEEISNEGLRETIITLYFLDKDTGSLKSEGKIIDSSELLENPYKYIVQSLLDGPKNDTLKSVFPENVKILNATISQNCVTLNFSEELLKFENETQKYNIINSILNSLAQLTEVNSIKIQVNGETVKEYPEEYSDLHQKP